MKKTLTILFCILLVAGLGWKIFSGKDNFHLGTPEILGGVVRTEDAQGDHLHFLTSQWEQRIYWLGGGRSSSTKKTESWLNIDLWTLDAATAQPVSRKRIKREKMNGDAKAMGVEQGVLWARIPELVGIRLSDGVVIADPEKIVAKNPGLAGLLPGPPSAGMMLTEAMQPLKFDPQTGLIVRLNDARMVRIDAVTLEATPFSVPAKAKRDAPPVGAAITKIASGMDWRAMVRGLPMWNPDGTGLWLGLLSEADVATMQEVHNIGYEMDFNFPHRQKVFRAKLTRINESSVSFGDPEVLPESPDFLMAGLLTQTSDDHRGQTAMFRREPDSVFVLSRDLLGDAGRLQIARVAGPSGKAAWSTALPLSQLNAWVPGENVAVLLGPDPSAARSPMAEEGENEVIQLVSLDLKTGEFKTFNRDLHRDWPVDDDQAK